MSGGFLSRWSRRKVDDRAADDVVNAGDGLDLGDVAREDAPLGEVLPAEAAEPELSLEEIAALPAVEDVTSETDISAFMRRGVPQALRKAVLRRVWALDPAIRDYVCEAREYAYDWNTPGGVPGSGPLLPDEAISVEHVFAERDGVLPHESSRDAVPQSSGSGSSDETDAAMPQSGAVHSSEDHARKPPPAMPAIDVDQNHSKDEITPIEAAVSESSLTSGAERRHGGAVPF